MSYQLYDIDGYVGDVGTTEGLEDLSNYLIGNNYANLSLLMKAGEVFITEDLIEEAKYIGTIPDQEVDKTMQNLRLLLNKSDIIAIISDGLNDDLPIEEENA